MLPLFCLEVWGTDYQKIKNTCLFAEELDYYGFYYGESLTDIDLDCWTILSALSSITEKIKLGPVITYLLPQYRNISLIAKQAITLQDISDGRLEFRTGAGANLQYANQWWHPYGIDYPENSKRVSIIEEGVELLKIIFEDSLSSSSMISSTINFNGNYFKINGVNFKKPLQKIPITIAAKKYKMIRIAANFADIWETSFMSPDQFLLSKKFFEKCLLSIKNNENIGINKDRNVLKSIELDVLIADTENELEYKKKILAMERGPQVYYQIIKNGLVGLPDTIAKKVKEYLNAGIDQFFLAFQDPFDLKSIELFMNSMRDFGLR